MKNKLLLFLCCCFTLQYGYSQSLNQNASWPNSNWTLSGSYSSGALLSDPTGAGSTFTFDDDAAGSGSADNIIATSPVIDLTTANGAGETWITISGDYVYRALSGDVLVIETYDADADTWSALETFSGNSSNTDYRTCSGTDAYTTSVLDISGFTATQLSGFQYRISYDDQAGWLWGWCLTSPTITSAAPPSCLDPTSLTASSVTATSASLGWTESGTATVWDIEWGVSGFTQGDGTAVTDTTDNPYSLTGLSSNTSYDYYVRADCGGSNGTSAWAGPFSFTTLPGAHSFPLNEDFESGFTLFDNAPGNDVDWTISTSYFKSGTQSIHNAYSASDENIVHETGILDLSGTSNALLEFWHIAKTEGTYDKCYVEISTDAGATYTALPNSAYQGTAGDYGTRGYFHEDSYTIWGTSSATPDNATWWQKETFNLSAYNVANVRLRFRLTSDGSGQRSGWYVDDISVTEPSCAAPTDLSAGSITASSASLSWTENNSATAWEVVVQAPGTGEPAGAGTAVTTNPYAASGLDANTAYEYYVRSNCGGSDGNSDWAGPFNFRTACVAVTSFDENFDSVSTPNLPDCWTELVENGASSSGYVRTSTSADNSAPNGVQLYYSNSSVGDIILVSPLLSNLGDGTHRLIFDGNTTSSSQDIIVGTLSDPNDVSTFTPIQTFDLIGFTYTTFEQSFASYSGTDQYIGFKRITTSTFTNVYLDNIKWEPIPSCVVPTDLAAGSITSDSASLSWTENNSATAWEVVVQAPGTGEPAGAGTAVTTNPYTASGLDSNTAYEYYVRSNCGGGDLSAWAGPFSFTTPCAAFSPEYTEDFTSYLPGCWSEAQGELDAPTTFTSTSSSNWTSDGFAQSGSSGAAKMNIYSTGRYEWLVSPSITLDGGQQLVFDLAYNDFGSTNTAETTGSDDVFAVIISTDNGATWSSANTLKRWDNAGSTDVLNNISNSGETVIINLSSYTGTVKIGFYAESTVSNADNDLTIDNFTVQDIPSCIVPSSLSASSITDTSASLSWTENGTATAWEVVVQASGTGEPAGAGTAVTTNPYTASSLDSNTAYEYYVRADCGGSNGTSAWAGPFSFTTPCAAFSPEYTEDFTSYLPGCWSEAKGELDAPTTFTSTSSSNWTSDGFAQSGSSGAAKMNIFSTGRYEWLVSPSITLNGGQQLVFDLAYNDFGSTNTPETTGSDDVFAVIISTDNGATWSSANTLKRWDNAGSTDVLNDISNIGETITIDLSSYSGNVQIGFYAESTVSNADNDLTIDNFIIQDIPSCIAPSDLAAGSITTDSASLSWTENNSATTWDIEYGESGFTQGTVDGTVVSVSSNPYSLTGLDESTSYEYYVRSNCGGGDGDSDWAGPFAITTLTDYCSIGTLSDPGGPNGDYASSADEVYTICPGSPGEKVVIDFTQFSFENESGTSCYDGIELYDGDSTSAPLIRTPGGVRFWCWDRDDAVPNGSGDLLNRVIAATSSSGCITIKLFSDGSSNREGFTANISCVATDYVWDGNSWSNMPEGNSTSSDKIFIKDGAASPVLSQGISTERLFIEPGASLTANSGAVIIAGDLANHGSLLGSEKFVMQSASAQSIIGEGAIDNLEINNANGVTIVDGQEINSELTLTSGTLTTNDALTLKSNASGTAVVSAMNTASAGVSGNVTVERFIPDGNRAFRFLGTSVSGPSVYESWQESGNNANGFGMHVTGIVGTVGTNNATTGLDETVSGNPSMYRWDNSTQNWVAVTNTKTEILSAGTFYRTLVRGNRATDLSVNNATMGNPVTLRATGTLATGDQMVSGNASSATFLAVGNPYQSKVDLSLASRSSISDNVYYWDPTLNTQGAYTTIDVSSSAAGTNGSATRVLEPGQAVFLQEVAGASSIMFSEDDKVSGSNNVGILSTPNDSQFLRMKLYHTNQLQAGGNSIDGLIMKFNSSENIGYDFSDAVKLSNIDENMAISHNSGNLLAIEKRPAPSSNEVIQLDMDQYRSSNYSFTVNVDPLVGLKVYVKDNLDNSMTEVLQGSGDTVIDFTVDVNDPASVDRNRFQLVFETVTLGMGDELASTISLYPNPVSAGDLNVQLNAAVSDDLSVSIFNSIGQQITNVQFDHVGNNLIKITGLDQFAQGVYFVKVDNGGQEFSSKFIIE